MEWSNVLAVDTESAKAKVVLWILDKLFLALLTLVIIIAVQQRFQREIENTRFEFERTRLARDLLPFILDGKSDVVCAWSRPALCAVNWDHWT